jgi:hypothetical protein
MTSVQRNQVLDPETGLLLHEFFILDHSDAGSVELERVDLSAPSEFLQGAVINIPPHHTFRAHKHLERERAFSNLRAQESWVVIAGAVEVDYYSESGVLLQSACLGAGDASISYRGGHGYRTLDRRTLVYEFKSGPYEGQSIDKAFFD